jgi:hypothetical protein
MSEQLPLLTRISLDERNKTMEQYIELLAKYPEVRYLRYTFGTWAPELPIDGGKPSKGTSRDQRLKENKTAKPAQKPATMPAKKGK